MAHRVASKWQLNRRRRCTHCSRSSARWLELLLPAMAPSGESSSMHFHEINYCTPASTQRCHAIPAAQMSRGHGAVQTPAAFSSARGGVAEGTLLACDRSAGVQPERLLVALGVFRTMNWIATLSESVR